MKLKWNLISLCAISFIFFVSFKILQPENDEDVEEETAKKRAATSALAEHKQLLEILEEKYVFTSEYCKSGQNPWEIAVNWVNEREVHPEYTPEMGCVLHAMKTLKIISADVGYKGTQLKMFFVLEGGQKVVFKPKWYERDTIQDTMISGWDRHNGEIASFHIGRILELRRTPLTVGRRVNLQTEVIPVATEKLLKTFFAQGNNQCMYGTCYYCQNNATLALCANGDILEGAMILWLPEKFQLIRHKNPWIRSYKQGRKKRWEYEMKYCDDVRQLEEYRTGPRLMDLIDSVILDYLVGNADRHHYETLCTYSNSMILLLDNGKSFGDPDHDEFTILAPLYQCCQIRESTWQSLLLLQNGTLSKTLQRVLDQDSIAPVLHYTYYPALDRRLRTLLIEVRKCIETKGVENVIVTGR